MIRTLPLFLVIGLVTHCSFISHAQEKKTFSDIFSVKGYISHMNSCSFVSIDSMMTDNLIHNRLDMKAFVSDNFTIVAGIRNRLFYGEGTKSNVYLGPMLDVDHGEVDMSFVLLDKPSMVIHSIIDRAYIRYINDNWDISMGRQRINWGVNLAWNPNDLFNAYSLIDFDYQERPGTDALRIQYFMNGLSSIELACQPGEDMDQSILAGMYKFNKWQYDFQVLGGNYFTDLAIGTGWAGNLKNMGLKGETTYFHPKENYSDTSGVLSSSVTLDYSLKNGLYLNASALYNSGGSDNATSGMNPFQSFMGTLSAKNLMPSMFTYFLQGSGAFNPALTGSFALFYMQGLNTFFCMPSINYRIQESWEIMLLGQSAIGKMHNNYEALGNMVYVRLMYSY